MSFVTPEGRDTSPQGRSADEAYPDELAAEEQRVLGRDRKAALGIGLSGGGIRSATFALGVFQALAGHRMIRDVDVLSTVSGGGYFGGFLRQLFARPFVRGVEDVEEILRNRGDAGATAPPGFGSDPERAAARGHILRWLRENGRYLAPRGAGDLLLDAAVLFRNWLSVQVTLWTLIAGLVLLTQLPVVVARNASPNTLLAEIFRWPRSVLAVLDRLAAGLGLNHFPMSPWFVLAVALLAVVLPLVWSYWLVRSPDGGLLAGSHGTAWSGLIPGFVLLAAASVPSLSHLVFPALGLPANGRAQRLTALVVGGLTVAATFLWALASVLTWATRGPDSTQTTRQAKTRHTLSVWLSTMLVALAGVVGFAIIDTLGGALWAYSSKATARGAAGLSGLYAVLAAIARRLSPLIDPSSSAKRLKLPLAVLAAIGAAVIVFLLLIGVDAASQVIAWDFDLSRHSSIAVGNLIWWVLGTLLLAAGFGRAASFLNNSTLQPLYAARLARAYLGASNLHQRTPQSPNDRPIPVIEPASADDTVLHEESEDDPARTGSHGPTDIRQTPSPIHLINVTINETYDGRSNIQQQDRKGVGMAVGPAGLSVGVCHHAVLRRVAPPSARSEDQTAAQRLVAKVAAFVGFGRAPGNHSLDVFPTGPDRFRVFEYSARQKNSHLVPWEQLTLGQWVGISGAAFSTGLGYQTSIGLSILATLANVRLGYWWRSGVDPSLRHGATRARLGRKVVETLRACFPIQSYFIAEALARFPGTADDRWYLSDGGHFENMGGYELIRRRLPFIVIVDAEADPDYTFGGLAGLIRKARLDFATEIEFLPGDSVEAFVAAHSLWPNASVGTLADPAPGRKLFGGLDDLRPQCVPTACKDQPGTRNWSAAHCAVATIRYPTTLQTDGTVGPAQGVLVYIKPTLTGLEPADIEQYARAHPSFPHETTAEQFFAEDQWESYRKLGEDIGTLVAARLAGPSGQ